MTNILELIRHAHSLGAELWVEGESLELDVPADFPDELVELLRHHKSGLMAHLKRDKSNIQPPFDVAFPIGYRGLPRAQVDAAEIINDKLGIKDLVLRKYNVLTWVRSYLQWTGHNQGELYQSIVQEQKRLGELLPEEMQ